MIYFFQYVWIASSYRNDTFIDIFPHKLSVNHDFFQNTIDIFIGINFIKKYYSFRQRYSIISFPLLRNFDLNILNKLFNLNLFDSCMDIKDKELSIHRLTQQLHHCCFANSSMATNNYWLIRYYTSVNQSHLEKTIRSY